VDIELLLDPSGVITQLLAYVDLTELVKEQPGRDKGTKDSEGNEQASVSG
jgi:hypothetical protein